MIPYKIGRLIGRSKSKKKKTPGLEMGARAPSDMATTSLSSF